MPDIILIILFILGASGALYSHAYTKGYKAALRNWRIDQTVYKPLRDNDKL